MAQFSLRLSRKDFITFVLNEFEKDVKNKAYNKMNYTIWRTLKAWATENQYEGCDFKIQKGDRYTLNCEGIPFISVGLCSSNKILPNPHYFDILPNDNKSFGSWLKTHWDGLCYCDRDTIEEFEKMIRETPITYEYTQPSIGITNYKTDDLITTKISSNSLAIGKFGFNDSIDNLEKTLNEIIEKASNNEKENRSMNFNFDFGPVDSSVRMSLYGMAIKNASGTYVAYDANSKQIMDVDIFNFEGANKFIYKMPTPIKGIRSGDVVIHARKPMFVQMVQSDNRLKVLDIYDGEEKTIVPAKSPFNFDFITKVVSLVDMAGVANADNPFGNMLPFLLMGDKKNDDLLPMVLMASGNMDMSNPMMMWALMGNRTNDPMMLALAMGAFNKPTCACGGNCHCHEDTDHADK